MKQSYKKVYVVRDAATGIPLYEQEYMTLTQAIKRYNKEVQHCVDCFNVSKKDAQKWWDIFDTDRNEIVL